MKISQKYRREIAIRAFVAFIGGFIKGIKLAEQDGAKVPWWLARMETEYNLVQAALDEEDKNEPTN